MLITTGSQGEPMSALTRMAFSDHRKVAISPNDYVIISATPIPGNEKTVSRVINELMKLGAEVVYEKMYDVHVSGHACSEELKLMLGIVKPKFFIPVHGEQKHLQKHANLAVSMGMDRKNIVIVENGASFEISNNGIKKVANVPAGQVFVDGLGVGDVGSIVIRDRKHLAEDGIIMVVMALNKKTHTLAAEPEVITRGFVYMRDNEGLIEEMKRIARTSVEDTLLTKNRDWNTIKTNVKNALSNAIYDGTKRKPMILPVILDV